MSSLHTAPVAAESILLDDFETVQAWSAIASEGASVRVFSDHGHTGLGMRVDFEFSGAGGWVSVQKTVSIPLPADYVFSFWLRGAGPPNNFEFKLIDPSGENVWWYKRREVPFPTAWERLRIKKARLDFAWGPAAGSVLHHVATIAFSVSAGRGGKGSVWLDEMRLDLVEPPGEPFPSPQVQASSALPGHEPSLVLDGDRGTSWKTEPVAASQWLVIDFQRPQDYGGLIIDWDGENHASSYDILVSDDGTDWKSVFSVRSGNGGRDYIYLPEGESRFVKLDLQQGGGQGYGIADVEVKPFGFSASINQFFTEVAADAPLGTYPKYLSGRQTYWTVVGVNGDTEEALINEEGMIEVGDGGFSIEPFLFLDGNLITWNSVRARQELEDGYLPIPSVVWDHEAAALTITAFAAGQPWLSVLYARYRVTNHQDAPLQGRLFLALRPFQVNPPWQSLKRLGGAVPVRELRAEPGEVLVNGEKAVILLTPADGFGAAPFEQGPITDFLRRGILPQESSVSDSFGYASGALAYDLDVPARGTQDVLIAVPLHGRDLPHKPGQPSGNGDAMRFENEFAETRAAWENTLDRVSLQLPPQAEDIVRTVKSTLAHILINRDEHAIQPGSRCYDRSWMRDGAVTTVALLEMGFVDEVRDFLRWFAGFQSHDGKIPCCVDERGADPTPEHDSHGEFIYAVAEYYRFTRDIGFLAELWPNVRRAVDYLESLRRQRLAESFRSGDGNAFYGLLPPSISHEGYASRPVHSYWDDFFALRGFKDAAQLAAALGNEEDARHLADLRDEFRRNLVASIGVTMAKHGIDYIPGSADLGDFDPTATAIALTPVNEGSSLPREALRRTFDRYYGFFQDRKAGRLDWQAYTAYELRNVSALVLLGSPDRGVEVLRFLLDDRRPPGWNQWPEITWRDAAAPKFIGDMPHTWIGATFVQAVRRLFAYESEPEQALVLAAGLPRDWITSPGGVGVRRLPTHYGILHYTLHAEGETTLRLKLRGDLALPAGKIIARPPMGLPLRAVSINGVAVTTFAGEQATIAEFPADVVLEYAAP